METSTASAVILANSCELPPSSFNLNDVYISSPSALVELLPRSSNTALEALFVAFSTLKGKVELLSLVINSAIVA